MFYECRFCNKLFKKEHAFIKHYCNARKKHDELSTIEGQIGFFLYERWIHIRHLRNVDHDDFKASRFFNAFIKFAKFYRKIKGLPDIDQFLRLMISKNIQPSNWVTDKVLSYYLDFIDKTPAIEKITRTSQYIIKLADAYDCDTADIFDHVEFNIIIDFIKLQKLSPWILLNSKKFIMWIRYLDDEQQLIIDGVVDSYLWRQTFDKDKSSVTLAKKFVKELDL